MNDCALPTVITAMACAIAQQIEDDNELALLAAVLLELSDTLSTIVARRTLCKK